MEQTEALKLEAVNEQANIITIAGGVHMEVTHIDGSRETIKVRQIPATKIEAFMQKLSDESFSASIYCGKPQSWIDTLTQDSLNEVIEKGWKSTSLSYQPGVGDGRSGRK